MIASTLEPQSVDELAQIVRETAPQNLAIAAVGSGTMLSFGNPPEREDLTIRTRALRRVVDYEPEDQVIVVEAGIMLGELQAVLAEKKQRLAIDPVGGEAMTIGGMLSTNTYGPSALCYGTLKDLIVGIEIVRADGAIARAGGKVVKNVAGFDVSKLMVGSLGTLAIITKATFRLHPLPEASRKLAFNATPAQVFPFVLALRDAQLDPSAIAAHLAGGAATVEILFEGFGPGVEAQSAKCEVVATQANISKVPSPSCHGERSDAEHRPSTALGTSSVEPRAAMLKATFPPSEISSIAERVPKATIFPSLGVAFIELDPHQSVAPFDSAPSGRYAQDDIVRSATSLRDFFEGLGGTLVIERMPQELRSKIDAWGTPPPSFALMKALKERFDPTRRLNPGRFVGGL